MANCHDLFQTFHDDKIVLTKAKREKLISARDALEKKITNYFINEQEEKPPIFKEQGSFAMKTIINPIDDEYDIDHGVYLQNLGSDMTKWPNPETVHGWIIDAVTGHTDDDPTDKQTCVRVKYAGFYHADLPIYSTWNNNPFLAEKLPIGWHVSNAGDITKWFEREILVKGEQLRRIVRYLKAWADFNTKPGKLPCGFVLTVLADKSFTNNERDDIAFVQTASHILSQLRLSHSIANPVDAKEDLSKDRDDQIKNLQTRLTSLLKNAESAIREADKKKAAEIWRKEFGDRFPIPDDTTTDDKPLKTSRHSILGRDDARSA